MEKASLTKYRPVHDFRKSFKTEKKRQGVIKEFTKYLQGHATDSTDNRILNFTRQDAQVVYIEEYKRNAGN